MAAYKPMVKRETGVEKTIAEKEEEFKEVEYNDGKTDNDKEDWKCKACGDDNGDPKKFFGVTHVIAGFTCVVQNSADDYFQCQYCQEKHLATLKKINNIFD